MTAESKFKGLLALVANVEDEARSITRSPADLERSRSQLMSSVETQERGALTRPTGGAGYEAFLNEQLLELLGPAATRRALELAAAALGKQPGALIWEETDAVVAALRPLLVQLLGTEIATSAIEGLYLGALAARRP